MSVFTSSLRLCVAALVCFASVTAAIATAHAAAPFAHASQISPVVPVSTPVIPQHLVVRHPAGSYLPNTVIIKTRGKIAVSPNAKGFMSTALTQGLALYDVRSVRAPFAAYENTMSVPDMGGVGRMYEVAYNTAINVYDVCIELSRNPEVEYAVPVYNRYADYKPNDPLLSQQYAAQKVQAEQAWDVTKGSKDVLIAIVDTGVDYEHEDLAGNLWTNPNEIAGNGKDDDNNGKIDDVHGWDFVGNVSLQQIFNGQYQEDNDPKVRVNNLQWYDVRSHGTTVAGAAAAVTDNAKGIAGMGFNCRYVPIKCGSDNGSTQGVYRGYEAILYAARLGADVINCSWGGIGSSPAELDIITQAMAMGSLVVAASGNETMFTDVAPVAHYPSNYPNVLSVGATQATDGLADFSNYGARTFVYAPGDNVRTTAPDNQYAGTSGTSIASPMVAGVAALVKSVHPDWTPRQILQQIRSTCDNVITGTTSETRYLFYGRVNAYRAVQYNKTFTSGQRLPGISSTTVDVLPDAAESKIRTLDPTPVKITLKNYLAAAPNVQVTARALDGFTSLPTTSFSVGTLATLAEQSFTLTVQLSPLTPWSDGNVDVLLTYKSGEYEDYERVSIPVALPANGNTSTKVQYPLYPIDVQWQSASAPALDVCWAVGFKSDGGYFLSSSVGSPNRFTTKPAFAVAARSNSTAYVGVSAAQGGNAEILKTTDGGQNWTNRSVSSITNFINGVYFFDNTNGIFLGDPLSSRWGIGRTTDAGGTWTQVNSVPTPISGEQSLVGAAGQSGDKVWFGTSKGRVIYSNDRGQSWKTSTVVSNAVVLAVSFASPDRGVALYRTGADANLPTLVASTIDSGKTWATNLFNFSTVNFQPIGLYSAEGSSQTVAVGSGSEMLATMDNGRTWGSHRTGQRGLTLQSAGAASGTRMRLWTVGAALGYTESTLPREKMLAADVSSVAFGTVVVGSTATRTVLFSNTGIKDVLVSELLITGGTAEEGVYSVVPLPALPAVVAPGKSLAVDIVFAPVKSGYRTSTLKVTSDADPTPISVSLTGIAQASTVGVDEKLAAISSHHYPQPASDLLTISLELPIAGAVRAEVVSMPGAIVWSGSMVKQAGTATLDIPLERLASGVYLYRLQTPDGRMLVRSFVVQR